MDFYLGVAALFALGFCFFAFEHKVPFLHHLKRKYARKIARWRVSIYLILIAFALSAAMSTPSLSDLIWLPLLLLVLFMTRFICHIEGRCEVEYLTDDLTALIKSCGVEEDKAQLVADKIVDSL